MLAVWLMAAAFVAAGAGGPVVISHSRMLPLLLALATLPSAFQYGHARPGLTGDVPGLLVMAHGGSPEWDAAVRDAVAPLRARYPVAVAFGMADPSTLRAALDSLSGRGVTRVAVVRLFLDGQSFLHQTEYVLGLRADAPPEPVFHGHTATHEGGHSVRVTALGPFHHDLTVSISGEGLMDADVVGPILTERVRALSADPDQESVLVLAHGTGDDDQNARWVDAMEGHLVALRAQGFRRVLGETLREDWPERRAEAERRIRSFVESETSEGRVVLVVPFRLFGFGPYHEVLEGLDYRASEVGFLPHLAITEWIEAQYRLVVHREGWMRPSRANDGA